MVVVLLLLLLLLPLSHVDSIDRSIAVIHAGLRRFESSIPHQFWRETTRRPGNLTV